MASVLVLVLGGFLLMQQATAGVVDGKTEAAKNEARQAVDDAQQQLNAADQTGEVDADKLLLELAIRFADQGGAASSSRSSSGPVARRSPPAPSPPPASRPSWPSRSSRATTC